MSPGYRVCDSCVVVKRPCVFRPAESSVVSRLRDRIASIRTELNHMIRILDSSDLPDPSVDAVSDTSSGKLYLSDISFDCVIDSVSIT